MVLGLLLLFLPFFFGFVAAKPPLARPVAFRSSAAASHRVIIFPDRVDGVSYEPRRVPLAEWSLVL